jgi:hypothetical protein
MKYKKSITFIVAAFIKMVAVRVATVTKTAEGFAA